MKKDIPNLIISGDPFFYYSLVENSQAKEKRVWLLGPNTAMVFGIYPDRPDKTNLTITDEVTKQLKNGSYEVIFEFSDNPDHFDLNMNNRNYPDWVMSENGNLVLDLSIVRKGGMKNRVAADTLEKAMLATGSERVERTTMNVTDAWIHINPIGNHTAGDLFTISGTTNLAAGDEIFWDIRPADYRPSEFSDGNIVGATVQVKEGPCGINSWSIDIDSKTFAAKEYNVWIDAVTRSASAYERFVLSAPGTPGNQRR